MTYFATIISTLLLLCLIIDVNGATVMDDYAICKAGGFGRTLLLCDIDDALSLRTQQKLISLLNDLQRKVKCNCESECRRPDGNDRYIGVLLVTNSTKIAEDNEPLNETARKIYDDAQLGNVRCDNGLLIIYIKDKKQLVIYHGSGSYRLLDTRDLIELHNVATKNKSPSDDMLALQYLLSNYENARKTEMQRAETWTPIVGLFLALLLVLIILAILLTLFLARFCCCCARRIKEEDEIYHTGTIGGSKLMEPILVATPSPERIYGTQADAIYSTPYSGTPLPPPHLPVMKSETYPGSLPSSTQTATPASTQKHRLRPLHASIPHGFSPAGTPTVRNRFNNSNKVDDSTQTNGDTSMDDALETKRPQFQMQGSTSIQSGTSGGSILSPRTAENSSIQRSTGYTESDLSFLDPRRKQEVQTRTDFIY